MPNMLQLFKAGDTIYGYCGGAFGRDDYDTKVCVKVTPNYAVFENSGGFATVLNFNDNLVTYDTEKWKENSEENDYGQ